MIGIYKIENLINGKIYIGQSKNIKKRWYAHRSYIYTYDYIYRKNKPPLYLDIESYGIKNFSFSILEECTIEELNEKEKYYINLYNSYIKWKDSNGYNLTRGGSAYKQKEKIEIENLIIRYWEQGKSINTIHNIIHISHETIRTIIEINCPDYSPEESFKRGIQQSEKSNKKPVNRYDLQGNFIASYPSINQAALILKRNPDSISLCANFKRETSYNEYWIFAEENQEESLQRKINGKRKFFGRSIDQYDLKGNYIQTFKNGTVAAQQLQVSSSLIFKSALNIGYTCKNFFWKYTNDERPLCTNKRQSGFIKRPVEKYDLQGKYIKTYESITAAAKDIGLKNPSSIRECCLKSDGRKERKSSGGFQWKFADDKETIITPLKKRTNYKNNRSRAINKYSLNGVLLESFDFLKDAALSVGMNTTSGVKRCCEGVTSSYKGYKWAYANQNIKGDNFNV